MVQKIPNLDYDVTRKSVRYYFCKQQHSLGNLEAERMKDDTFLDKGFDHRKNAPSKFDKLPRSSSLWSLFTTI